MDQAITGRKRRPASRWDDERPGSQPEWATICEKLNTYLPIEETRSWLADQSNKVSQLTEIMHRRHVEDEIIQRLSNRKSVTITFGDIGLS